jgi:gag-polypeptide of LTR copia-type
MAANEHVQIKEPTFPFDPSSPYFVHLSDKHGVVIVSPVLDGDNYPTWKRSMTVALGAKIKLCFIDGT